MYIFHVFWNHLFMAPKYSTAEKESVEIQTYDYVQSATRLRRQNNDNRYWL